MGDEDIREKFVEGVMNVAGVCLEIGYPTIVSVPHSILNGFKNLLAIAAVTDVTFKEYLADPSKFAALAPAATAAAVVEEKVEEAKPESSEEDSDADMGFGLI